jgi:shikimate kinase
MEATSINIVLVGPMGSGKTTIGPTKTIFIEVASICI